MKYRGKGFMSDKDSVDLKDFDTKRLYKVWLGVLQRSYCEKLKSRNTWYKDVGVSENFLDFNFFLSWSKSQIGYNVPDWQLDKDILVKGNKTYSPETCCFVPREVNNIFIRSLKQDKELPVGVTMQRNGKYRARVNWEGVEKCLGAYEDIDDASLSYKTAKEAYAREVAEKWKGVVDVRIYKALMEHKED